MGKNKAGAAITWSLLTQVLSKLISPIVNMILARLLAPEAFGAIATIDIVITFAEIFTDAGFQKYIVQHEFRDDDELNNNTNVAFWTNLIVSVIFIAAIVIARNPIAELVGSPGLGTAIAIASLNIALVTFSSTQTARYRRDMDFKTLFYARIFTILLPVFVTVPLAFILQNYWALLIGTLVTNLVNAVVLTVFSKWKPKLFFSVKMFKEMFAFSMWILLDSVAVWLTVYIGTFIVGRYLDDYHLGIYKTSINTVNSIVNIFLTSIAPVMFSELSRYQNDDHMMKRAFYKYQRLSAVFLLPLGLGIFVYQDLVRTVMLGAQWTDATEFIGIWGLVSCITTIFGSYCSTYYRSKGKPKLSLIAQITYLCVLVLALLIAVQYSFRTLYYVRALATLFAMLQAFVIMKVVFGFKIYQTVKNVLPMIVSALIMGVAGYGLQQLSSAIWWQFAGVVICAVIYFAVLLGCFVKVRQELLEVDFVKKMLRKIKRK